MMSRVIIEKVGAEDDLEAPAPPSISEILTNVWLDTKIRAPFLPFKPSIKVRYERGKILNAIFPTTRIEVTSEDTLVAGHRLYKAGLNPCILNFADDKEAGGIVENGNAAQEESLWRRTNLCVTQVQPFYPLGMAPSAVQEGVYTPLATVFKDTEENECANLREPWSAAFIAVPGLKFPRINRDGHVCLEDLMAMRAKIALIFQTAKEHGHESLVLGPLGCGVWRSPPRHVAEIFRGACLEYKGVFKHIVFACLVKGRGAASTTNYTIFKDVFSTLTI
jgi:uncharacterized protein (TIGR02452 family)